MQYEPKKNQSHVKGDAHAIRTRPPSKTSPLPRTQTLTADYFQVNFSNLSDQQSSQNIDTIEAEGNVYFQEEDFSIRAERCTYDCKTNIITCDGKIVLTKAGSTIKGQKATANLESDYYNVTGKDKSDTVQAVLLPNSIHP
ncbi:LptA/OstA family protein [Candidatus Finniella inopinata]|nr:LptA/OstA family protein [Candidatus Finniella inopinata]